MTFSFSHIVETNNAAVRLFEAGSLSEAKVLFRKVIDDIKSVQSLEKSRHLRKNRALSKGFKAIMFPMIWSQAPKVETCSKNGVFIFARTVMLAHQPYVPSLSRIFMPIALYNLALTVHIEGSIRSSSSHFEASCRLYDMAFKLLKEAIGQAWSFNNDVDLLRLSMLNNTGAIFSLELLRYEDGQRCFQAVAKLLSTRNFGNQTNAILNREEIGQLIMNLYVKDIAVAPAA
jgi:hypothetical protein